MGGNRKEAKTREDENEGLRINPTLLPLPRSHLYCNLYSKPHPYPNPSLVQNDAKGRFIGHIDKRLKNAEGHIRERKEQTKIHYVKASTDTHSHTLTLAPPLSRSPTRLLPAAHFPLLFTLLRSHFCSFVRLLVRSLGIRRDVDQDGRYEGDVRAHAAPMRGPCTRPTGDAATPA